MRTHASSEQVTPAGLLNSSKENYGTALVHDKSDHTACPVLGHRLFLCWWIKSETLSSSSVAKWNNTACFHTVQASYPYKKKTTNHIQTVSQWQTFSPDWAEPGPCCKIIAELKENDRLIRLEPHKKNGFIFQTQGAKGSSNRDIVQKWDSERRRPFVLAFAHTHQSWDYLHTKVLSLFCQPTVRQYCVSTPGNQHSSNPREAACGFGSTFHSGSSETSFTH